MKFHAPFIAGVRLPEQREETCGARALEVSFKVSKPHHFPVERRHSPER